MVNTRAILLEISSLGLYLIEIKEGNLIEVNGHSGISGRTQYEFSDFQVNNLLDLTDVNTLEKLGTTIGQMKKMDPVNLIQYEFTHEVSIWAKNNGYSGIKFYGTQGMPDYINYVIFEQATVNGSCKGTVKPIPW